MVYCSLDGFTKPLVDLLDSPARREQLGQNGSADYQSQIRMETDC